MLYRALLLAAVVVAAVLLAPPARADREPHGGVFHDPDVSATHVVFVYANDLWLVPREGGVATPLASPPGTESRPRFSPDGKTIAFVGDYGGGSDVYTLSVDGGVPHRVTYHPGEERLCGWTPDGHELVFSSRGLDALGRRMQLFRVPAKGGLPVQLPVPYGGLGAIDETGLYLAYVPQGGDHPSWKRYRGGRASDVWVFGLRWDTDPAGWRSAKITDWEGADTWPMWHGKKVYYVSNQGPAHRMNVWVFDLDTKQRAQVTTFTEQDVRWPAMGPGPHGRGEIVFKLGTGLHRLDLETGEVSQVRVTIPGAKPALLPTLVDASKHVQHWNISPTGKRAVVQARGDVWTLPARRGSPRNLTRTSGIAERDPAWSPDGKWVAYFSDRTGEYELCLRPADGSGEERQVTEGSRAFLYRPIWSPDSKRIAFTDKAGTLFLHEIDAKKTSRIDQDLNVEDEGMWGYTWSHDGRWLAYARGIEDSFFRAIFLYDTESEQSTQVTSGRFNDENPTFDRVGDHLFFKTSRHFRPIYADHDQTWIYAETEILAAVPLRADQVSPFAPESDEEEVDDDEESADEGMDEATPAEPDDGISGVWAGKARGGIIPDEGIDFTLTLELGADGSLSGTFTMPLGTAEVDGGSFDAKTGRLGLTLTDDSGVTWKITGTVKGDRVSGTAEAPDMGVSVEFEAERTGKGSEAAKASAGDERKKGEKRKVVEIELEGFEARAVQLPVEAGKIGRLAVNAQGHLLYERRPLKGGWRAGASVHLFDLEDDKKKEKDVASGANDWRISADGKHLIVVRGDAASIQKAASGDGGKPVPTAGMQVRIDPREEWNQVFVDVWRIFRDYFYDPHMHGLDWKAVRETYQGLLDDCVTREDVTHLLQEMIGELNVGHANYFAQPFWRRGGGPAVGMLGVDWTLEGGAFRMAKIHRGAAWDVDARGPLGQPGLDVNEGDYLLTVNGNPVDTTKAPWAAFEGKVGRPVTLTVSTKPTLDDDSREILVVPEASEQGLRYRSWVEAKRAYVAKRTNGRVGYVHVPDTGRRGQTELYRQSQGQAWRHALIIDERWNGGGQLPDRFIELLNRPIRNYWARRDGRDWRTPFAAHQGPKCMLMNGASGSGGDAFPAYFRQSGLGKLIGTRTWGGLVGISGNPAPIDGTWLSVPTFAFYETDGTWGIEGHGVDPDIHVVDDPQLMVNGGDPQLDRAIRQMIEELKVKPYLPPGRPAYPDRSGMGLPVEDR